MERFITIIVSTVIYFAVLGATIAFTGAPVLLHAVDAVALFVAFWIPAQFLTRPETMLSQWPLLVAFILGGTLLWDVGSSYVIAKRELFGEAALLYPLAVAVFSAALLVHSLVGTAVRNGLTRRWSERRTAVDQG